MEIETKLRPAGEMRKRVPLWIGLAALLMLTPRTASAAEPRDAALPRCLDLTKYFNGELSRRPDSMSPFKAFAGRQEIDQLPFQMDGEAILCDLNASTAHETVHRDLLGIPVGCKFEELHLVHRTRWPDLQGKTIARIRLNYEDGSQQELPVQYGVHVRDGWRRPTEEKEALSDPNSKICWRGTPNAATTSEPRLFKSLLHNPFPAKAVTSLDLVSTRELAIYALCAATVANGDTRRGASPPQASGEPARHFDGQLAVRVLDQVTGKPIAEAVVETLLNVSSNNCVGPVALTSPEGEAVIRYPASRTGGGRVWVNKTGYAAASSNWSAQLPTTVTFKLKHYSDEVYGQYDREFRSYLAKATRLVGKETIRVERLSERFTVPQKLTIQGTPYDIGLTIGYIGREAKARLPPRTGTDRALNEKVVALYQRIYPQYLELVRGVAAAYDQPFEKVNLGGFERDFTTVLWCRLLKNSQFYQATDFDRFGHVYLDHHCSVASYYTNGHEIVGRNFDNPSDRPHFLATIEMAGTYKVMGHTIYGITSWAPDGMNEKGFSVSVTSNNEGKYACREPYPSEPAILMAHMALILMQTCATVDEALAVLRSVRVWFPDEGNHWLLADATGKSVVVEWTPGDRKLVVFDRGGPYALLTNTAFQEGEAALSQNCWRYRRAKTRLEAGVPDTAEMLDLMKSIRFTVGATRSLWTSIMDLNARTFEVHYFKEFDHKYEFRF